MRKAKGFLREFKIGDCVNDSLGEYLGRIQAIDPKFVKVRRFGMELDTGRAVFQIYKKEDVSHSH